MARAHLREEFKDAEGRPLTGATVYVYQQGTTTTITETIYTVDDTVGNTSTTSPLTPDSQGAIEFYLANEKRVDLKVVKTGKQDTTETYDVMKPGAAGAGGSHAFNGARVRRTANQSINNATSTALVFDTGNAAEDFDTDTIHDMSTNPSRLTPVAGWVGKKVELHAGARFAADPDGVRNLYIRKNGTTNIGAAGFMAVTTAGFQTDVVVSTGPIEVAASDYYEAIVYHEAGAAINAEAGELTFFAIKLLEAE